MMLLFRTVMDKEIVDRNGFKVGKVDDLLLELPDDGLPIVRAMITQNGAVARLFGRSVEALGGWLRQHLLGVGPDARPRTIGWEHITYIDVVVHTDIDRFDAGMMQDEQAIWERWIKPLPFSRR